MDTPQMLCGLAAEHTSFLGFFFSFPVPRQNVVHLQNE
jgi:hypothetical protein